jgi:hypothetical protein
VLPVLAGILDTDELRVDPSAHLWNTTDDLLVFVGREGEV